MAQGSLPGLVSQRIGRPNRDGISHVRDATCINLEEIMLPARSGRLDYMGTGSHMLFGDRNIINWSVNWFVHEPRA